jgi:hypothetical protein
MALRASVSQTVSDGFNLSFNDIIGHVPGHAGRGDAKKGKFVNRSGHVLVVYSVNPEKHTIGARRNGRKTNRTQLTRIGMFMFCPKTRAIRLVTCDNKPDGAKQWKPYTGSVTI